MKATIPSWVRISSIMVFALSFVIGMALVSWDEIGEVQNDSALATTIAIIVKGQAVSVLSTALGGVIEGSAYIVVIATYIVQKNREEGHAEGRAEGLAEGLKQGHIQGLEHGLEQGRSEGRSEGIAEAYADANAKNAAYFRRMKEALERGEDFDEPPPTFGDKQD